MEKVKFNKPILSLGEIICLLEKRGLIIEDKEKAKHDILHIGYFRLTGYFKFFQDKETNIFKKGISFEQVVRLYSFDRKLRLLTLDAIEKIEVSLKSVMNYEMYKIYGAFWYLNKDLFYLEEKTREGLINIDIYQKLILKIEEKKKKSSAIFTQEYFKKYNENYLPSWMLFEELTIGEVSNIYKLLNKKLRQEIANNYKSYELDLKIRIHLMVNIRNICAHHSRLWNKEYIVKPRLKDKNLGKLYGKGLSKNFNTSEIVSNYYNTALIINYLLQHINKNFSWLNELKKLFDDFKEIPKEKMGFGDNWEKNFK